MSKTYSYIWKKRNYPPFLMVTVVRATIFGFSKIFPSSIKSGGNYWENTEASYFYDKNELDITANKLSKLAIKSPDQIVSFFKISNSKAKNINLFVNKFLNNNQKKGKKELINFFKKFIDKFYDFYCYGTVPILMGYSNNIINQKVDDIMKQKCKKNLNNLSFFTDLMASEKKLISHDLELKILILALKAKSLKLKTQKDVSHLFKKDIANIQKKYGFLSFDLLDSLSWNEEHFAQAIFEKSSKDNLLEEIEILKDYEFAIKKRIKIAEEKLKLNKKEKEIFQIARILFYYKWAREYLFVEALYNFSHLLNLLGAYFSLNSLESKYFLPEDFLNEDIGIDLIKERVASRLKNFLFLIDDKEEKILGGREAKNYFNKLSFKEEIVNKKILKHKVIEGGIAYAGNARGVVRIINTSADMNKMKVGDILVSVATTPEIIRAMKKASAFITDEGGITCHAAIVARELKKPCIIGTKIATKVLKDGDLVEVDANKGEVKIIKRK